LKSVGIFSMEDIQPLQSKLALIEDLRDSDGCFKNDLGRVPPGQATLSSILHKCHRIKDQLVFMLDEVDPTLLPLHSSLTRMYKKLEYLKRTGGTNTTALRKIQNKLGEIESSKRHGTFFAFAQQTEIPRGQAVLAHVFEKCMAAVHAMNENLEDEMDPAFEPLLGKLSAMSEKLRSIESGWGTVPCATMEELGSVQQDLNRLDAEFRQLPDKAGGARVGAEMHRLRRHIQTLLEAAEPWVLEDPVLQRSYNALSQLRLAMQELHTWAKVTPFDMEPYHAELMRVLTQADLNHALSQATKEGASESLQHARAMVEVVTCECFDLQFKLWDRSDKAVSEKGTPIFDKLMRVKNGLVLLRDRATILTAYDILRYQRKLDEIDSKRQDGKFVVGGQVIDGQAVLHEMLEECYELAREMLECVADTPKASTPRDEEESAPVATA